MNAGERPIPPFDLHPARLLELCSAKRLGRTIFCIDSTVSTNTLAAAAALAGAREGTLFIAEEQTRGAGRKGREWHSVRGKSVAMSLVLRPVRREGALTAVFALAVARGLDGMATSLALKWPNDILLAGRKLGGILAETRGGAVVMGLGLNVNEEAADFPAALAGTAVSLRMAEGTPFDRGDVICRILESFERLYGTFERGGFGPLSGEIERRLLHIGKRVTIEDGGVRDSGVMLGITDAGYLRLDVDGVERAYAFGDVTVREESNGNGSRTRPRQ